MKTYASFSDDTFTSATGTATRYYYRACVYNSNGDLVRGEAVATAKAKGTFHEIFVTRDNHSPNFTNLAGADTYCGTVATNARLTGTWKAVLSNDSTNAKDRLTIGGSVFNMQGEELATSSADLWDGTLAYSVKYDELGTAQETATVWTGTLSNGTKETTSKNCSNWGATTGSGRIGYANSTTDWLNGSFDGGCGNTFSIYCISQ